MVLKEILKQLPSSVFIEDSWEVKGRLLFLSLMKHYAENGSSIKYIKFDCPLSTEKEELKDFPIQMEIFDWKKDASAFDLLKNCSNTTSGNLVVAIDSLSPLLIHGSTKDIITTMKEMTNKKISLLCLLHGDVHEKYEITQLDYAFSCHLTAKKVNGRTACKGVLKKTGGKVLDADEYYNVSPTWMLTDIDEIKEAATLGVTEAAKAPVPKSTFKLDLNPDEEKARSQVVLPYIRKTGDSAKQQEKRGQIFYEAEQPDWEDEDPDDDLEI